MRPVLCVIGGCNGAGKTTLARELLPLLGIKRFLNTDEIARGLSPLDPSLSAFRAGRILLEEITALLARGESFALESTLSGRTYVAMLQKAKANGYHVLLHYIVIGSGTQAVERVALRVSHGGHFVPEEDVRRRFARSRKHFLEDYLPLADEWVLWDNEMPPHERLADHSTHSTAQLSAMITPSTIHEAPSGSMSEMARLGLEASRRATAKMVDYYKRMGIRVTPQMTLAPKPKKRTRKATAD
jgi:predicted ABC-type ATPase